MESEFAEIGLSFVDPPIRWVGKTGQKQCQICGLFLRKSVDRFSFDAMPRVWRCVRMRYDSYYDAWEHE